MISGQGCARWAHAGGALVIAVLIAGCGDNYRPTVYPVNTNGPAPQPTSYAVVVSAPTPAEGAGTNGIVTIIDYSGDTIMVEATIGPSPTAFTLDEQGATGYTLNSDGTLSNFAITTTLQTKNVSYSAVTPGSQLVNLMPPSAGLWATDLTGNVVDLFTGSPQALQKSVPVSSSGVSPTMPVFIAGSATLTGQREYVLSQNQPDTAIGAIVCNTPTLFPALVAGGKVGSATPIEVSSDTADPVIPVGVCPVYAVQTPDQQRLFVLNRGDDTITVINTAKNTLDQCPVPLVAGKCPSPYNTNQNGQPITFHPVLPLSTASLTAANAPPSCNMTSNPTCGMGTVAGPVYAEYNAATEQLVVADYDGGSISVIDVSLDEYGNDSANFGNTYTIHVGNTAASNPASVTVLNDGTKAYTANQNDGSPNGTVTVVNLSTYTVEKTLTVAGHPRTVVNTQNSEFAKIYVDSPDSPYITIIESSPTITDQIDTAVLVQGLPIDIRTTTQNGNSGNNNFSSRVPGYGQPCNLPGAPATLAACQAIP